MVHTVQFSDFMSLLMTNPAQLVEPALVSIDAGLGLLIPVIIEKIKKATVTTVVSIDSQVPVAAFRVQLYTSFLGTKSLFVIRSDMTGKKDSELISLLSSYTGPNVIYTDIEIPEQSKHQTIKIVAPTTCTMQFLEKVSELLDISLSGRVREAVTRCLEQHTTLSCSQGVMLLQYCAMAGRHVDMVLTDWFNILFPHESHLFSLSHHFFMRDASPFFQTWRTIQTAYSFPFWTTYWSDQLWRAILFIDLMKKNGSYEARKIGQRLPFVFSKRLWRTYKIKHLAAMHSRVVALDRAFKEGTMFEHDLEFFYIYFLRGL